MEEPAGSAGREAPGLRMVWADVPVLSHFYLVLHPRLRCHTLTKKGSIGDLPNGLDEGVGPRVEVKRRVGLKTPHF